MDDRATGSQRPVKIALVEDHPATRRGQCAALAEFSSRVDLTGAFADARSFLRAAHAGIEVAVIDLQLPDMHGSALIKRLALATPEIRCIALTTFDDPATVGSAIRAGAVGYLLKDEPTPRLVQAIEEAARSEHPISSRAAGVFFRELQSTEIPAELSEREAELASALAEDLSYSECAERMGIAIGTVQDYVKRLYRKLDVTTKKEVRAWVTRHPRR